MKIFKAVLSFCVLVFLLSSCNDSEPNESESTIYDTSEISAQTTESLTAQTNAQYSLPKEIQAFIDIDWRTKYPEMVGIYYNDRQVGTPWGMPMYFCNIDNDDTYELIAKVGSYSDGGDLLFFYNYDASEIRYEGAVNGGSVITDDFENDLEIISGLSDEIILICTNKEDNTCNLLSCVKYASGGVYGYTVYFSSPDNSGIYHSEAIGSIYSKTSNYAPPYDWKYTSGDIESPAESLEDFNEHIRQYTEPYELTYPESTIESRLYTDIFLGNTPIEDEEYSEMISLLTKDIYDKYVSGSGE